jgi:hypothetical protein
MSATSRPGRPPKRSAGLWSEATRVKIPATAEGQFSIKLEINASSFDPAIGSLPLGNIVAHSISKQRNCAELRENSRNGNLCTLRRDVQASDSRRSIVLPLARSVIWAYAPARTPHVT